MPYGCSAASSSWDGFRAGPSNRSLLGDAAHPMFPFFAQGAAQSIADAAVPAGYLAASVDDPEQALQRYEAARIERATRLPQLSRARSDIDHLPDGPEQQARDKLLATPTRS